MHDFAALFDRLDGTTSTSAKVEQISRFLRDSDATDAAWAMYFLAGKRLKRLVAPSLLRGWAREEAGIEPWLFAECYATVGDLAETVSLLVGPSEHESSPDESLAGVVEERLLPLRSASEEEQRDAVLALWRELGERERFLVTKLMTGALRVGVSRGLVERAVASAFELPRTVVAHRLMGEWTPSDAWFARVIAPEDEDHDELAITRPYPFYLASPLEAPPESLGDPGAWFAEWKWDGIRAQLIRRQGVVSLWSRGEENITERFPEIVEDAARLGGSFVLDGEVLCWDFERDRPMPFAALQTRIGRKTVSARTRAEAPVLFLAYDLLEDHGLDLRAQPMRERRSRLESCAAGWSTRMRPSPLVDAQNWEERSAIRLQSRERGVEGLMLKSRDGTYQSGRVRGGWWKWKIDPLSLDVVMLYAQPGRGRRANLLTDYTFGVWTDADSGDRELITIAKAYSGLDQHEIERLDKWIRAHTTERFGPVRACEPTQVFELAFEGIAESSRHKSGLALRFPRIARWRFDKPAAEANTLGDARRLLDGLSP